MSDYFPQEVLIEIFLRAPIKCLLRCTSVCKSWHSLITGPNFITTHFNAKDNNVNTQLLLVRRFSDRTDTDSYSLHLDDKDTLDGYAELEFPFRACISNGYFRILDSCNGLLCLTDDMLNYTDITILWNPTIRKYVTLPEPNITFGSPCSHRLVLGFGFDHTTNDYKVVRMMCPLLPQSRSIKALPPLAELYKLSTGSWVSISPPGSPCIPDRISVQAFVNGAVHWLATKAGSECGFQCVILSVSMSDEVFEEMMIPTDLADKKLVVNMSVTVIGGLLCLVPYRRYMFIPNQCNAIWVMKEYGVVQSWTKLYAINDDLLGPCGRTFGIRKNHDRVLLLTSGDKLKFYNPKTCRIIRFGVANTINSIYANSYTESLVLLERGYGVQARQRIFSYQKQ